MAHHTRKQAAGTNGDYGASDMRGASAIHDALRAARILNRMAEKDADELSIPEQDRAKYFRVDRAKGNNSPAIRAVWRQFINVDLPNGDEVGVVAAWDMPGYGLSSAEIAEANRVADHVFVQVLTRFTLEGRSSSEKSNSVHYAPKVFAQEREEKTAKVGKTVLVEAMRRLFAAGRLRAETEGGKGHGVRKLVLTQPKGA